MINLNRTTKAMMPNTAARSRRYKGAVTSLLVGLVLGVIVTRNVMQQISNEQFSMDQNMIVALQHSLMDPDHKPGTVPMYSMYGYPERPLWLAAIIGPERGLNPERQYQ